MNKRPHQPGGLPEQEKLVPSDSPRGLHICGCQQDRSQQKKGSGLSPQDAGPEGHGERIRYHDDQHLLGQHSKVLC
jgi:hypothetical protein